MQKKIVANNKTFKTVKRFCEYCKISTSTFNKYAAQGLSPEEIFEKCVVRDFNGKIYSSIKTMCKKYHVSYTTYKARLDETNNLQYALTGDKSLLSVATEDTAMDTVEDMIETIAEDTEANVSPVEEVDVNEEITSNNGNKIELKIVSPQKELFNREPTKRLINDSLGYTPRNFLTPDFIAIGPDGNPVICTFWNTSKSEIDPWDSDIRRIFNSWIKYVPQIKLAKSLNGTFELIIFNGANISDDNSHVKRVIINDVCIPDNKFMDFYDKDYVSNWAPDPKFKYFECKEYRITIKDLKEYINKLNSASTGFTTTITTDEYRHVKNKEQFLKGTSSDEPYKKKKQVTVFGKTYPSISYAAKVYKIKVSKIYSRLSRGKTIEEAILMGP